MNTVLGSRRQFFLAKTIFNILNENSIIAGRSIVVVGLQCCQIFNIFLMVLLFLPEEFYSHYSLYNSTLDTRGGEEEDIIDRIV